MAITPGFRPCEAPTWPNNLSYLRADAGWQLMEALRDGGYDPQGLTREDALLWIANKAARLNV